MKKPERTTRADRFVCGEANIPGVKGSAIIPNHVDGLGIANKSCQDS